MKKIVLQLLISSLALGNVTVDDDQLRDLSVRVAYRTCH